jgi:hypothetical protein
VARLASPCCWQRRASGNPINWHNALIKQKSETRSIILCSWHRVDLSSSRIASSWLCGISSLRCTKPKCISYRPMIASVTEITLSQWQWNPSFPCSTVRVPAPPVVPGTSPKSFKKNTTSSTLLSWQKSPRYAAVVKACLAMPVHRSLMGIPNSTRSTLHSRTPHSN